MAVALLYGAGLLGLGMAVLADGRRAGLGWSGVVIGALTLVAAAAQFLDPDLLPGALVYGALASILAQLWLVALAVHLLRAVRSPTP